MAALGWYLTPRDLFNMRFFRMTSVMANKNYKFSPLDPDTYVWVDASRYSTLTALSGSVGDGSEISSWRDVVKSDVNLNKNSTDPCPKYKTNIINGMPVIRFSGTETLIKNSDLGLKNLSGITVAAVIRTTTPYLDQAIFSTKTNSGINSRIYFGPPGGQIGGRRTDGDLFEPTGSYGVSPNTTVVQIMSINYSAGTSILHINGSIRRNGSFQTEGNTDNTESKSVVVGGMASDVGGVVSDKRFQGDIAELFVIKRAMNESEINDVYNYLAGKWGFSSYEKDIANNPNLLYWLDSRDIETMKGSGGTTVIDSGDVYTWNNKKKDATTKFTQITTNKPKWKSSTVSSLPGVQFAKPCVMGASDLSAFKSIGGITIISVAAITSAPDTFGGRVTHIGGDGVAQSFQYTALNSSNATSFGIIRKNTDANSSAALGNWTMNKPSILTGTVDFNLPTYNKAYRDGVFVSQAATSPTAGVTEWNAMYNVTIGGEIIPSLNVWMFDGYIYEVMMFNKALTGSELDLIHNYLKQKWNIV